MLKYFMGYSRGGRWGYERVICIVSRNGVCIDALTHELGFGFMDSVGNGVYGLGW